MKDDLTPFIVGAIAAHIFVPESAKPLMAWVCGLGLVGMWIYGALKEGFRKN